MAPSFLRHLPWLLQRTLAAPTPQSQNWRAQKTTGEGVALAAFRGEAVVVEGDVAGLVAEDEGPGLAQGRVGTMATEQCVVGRAGELGEGEDLQLEVHAEAAAEKAEEFEAPVGLDGGAIEAFHAAEKEAGMFGFLPEPEVVDLPGFLGALAEATGVEGDQAGRATTIAKLELPEGLQQRGMDCGIDGQGDIPVRLGAVSAVGMEVADPLAEIQNRGAGQFTLHHKVIDRPEWGAFKKGPQ